MFYYMVDWFCALWLVNSRPVSNRTDLNQQNHIIKILLASFARPVRQVMDPRFSLPCFHGLCASCLGHKRKGKTSVYNLPYGPRTRLIGESLFTFFASLAYVPLFLLQLQNRLFWILKELHKISFVWKYGVDIYVK